MEWREAFPRTEEGGHPSPAAQTQTGQTRYRTPSRHPQTLTDLPLLRPRKLPSGCSIPARASRLGGDLSWEKVFDHSMEIVGQKRVEIQKSRKSTVFPQNCKTTKKDAKRKWEDWELLEERVAPARYRSWSKYSSNSGNTFTTCQVRVEIYQTCPEQAGESDSNGICSQCLLSQRLSLRCLSVRISHCYICEEVSIFVRVVLMLLQKG